MTITVYKMDPSPPARAVMMACELYGIEAEMIDVNLLEKEQMKPEYIKKNPLHTIPVLEDGDLILHDSHAILAYLSDAYGEDESLYPKDVKERALVNQKLFFNTSILFPRLRDIVTPAIREGVRNPPEKYLKAVEEAYSFIEEFLSRTRYLAGEQMTIADIAAIATVTSMAYIIPLDEYPKTQAWVNDIQEKPFCQKYNTPGAAVLGELIEKILDLETVN